MNNEFKKMKVRVLMVGRYPGGVSREDGKKNTDNWPDKTHTKTAEASGEEQKQCPSSSVDCPILEQSPDI